MPGSYAEFQFQTGAIKRGSEIAAMLDADPFQFQTGAIKSYIMQLDLFSDIPSFNSKLVRLKVKLRAGVTLSLFSFNSKLVRLEVLKITTVLTTRMSGFNSKLVRLEVLPQHKMDTMDNMFQFQTGAIRRQ